MTQYQEWFKKVSKNGDEIKCTAEDIGLHFA